MIEHLAIRAGARLGNWNDRVNGGDTRSTRRRPRVWNALDRLASRLYRYGPKPTRGGRTMRHVMVEAAWMRLARIVQWPRYRLLGPMFAALERVDDKLADAEWACRQRSYRREDRSGDIPF